MPASRHLGRLKASLEVKKIASLPAPAQNRTSFLILFACISFHVSSRHLGIEKKIHSQ